MSLRSLLLPLFSLIGGFVLLISVLLVMIANGQNRIAHQASEHLARSALSVTATDVMTSARDYAWWNATVENLVLQIDDQWAVDNIGAWANDGLGMDATLAVDGQDEIFYAAFEGERYFSDLSQYNSPELTSLIRAAREKETADEGGPVAVKGFVPLDGRIMLAGASAIMWENYNTAHDRGDAASVLVYLRRVDADLLNELEDTFLLADLSLISPDPAEAEAFSATLPLRSSDGKALAYIAWQPDRPGHALLADLAAPGIAAALILAAMIWLIIYRFRKAADNLQESHLLLSEQAYSLADQAVALREARDQADAANFAKSQFLALVSHEVRTPLNAIIGFSDIIAQQSFGHNAQERYQAYAKDILASGRHLLTLINDILDLSKIEAGRYELHEEEFEIDDVVGRCLTLFREKFDEKRLKVNYERCNLVIYADERAFKQILINLLSNAAKFTPEEGKIDIRCRSDKSSVHLEVKDSGSGIDRKDMKRVLEPFGQAENAQKASEGTGLGLSISKSLAEMHGGTLAIASELGKGTQVTFSLPAERLRPGPPKLAARA